VSRAAVVSFRPTDWRRNQWLMLFNGGIPDDLRQT
jgi:hypothetical protein